MTHEEVQAIIDEADYNKDGKLDYAEVNFTYWYNLWTHISVVGFNFLLM